MGYFLTPVVAAFAGGMTTIMSGYPIWDLHFWGIAAPWIVLYFVGLADL